MIKSVQTWSMEVADTRVLKMKINAGIADLSAAATTAAMSRRCWCRARMPRPTAASDHEQRGGEGGGEADGKGERGDENGHERVGGGGGCLGPPQQRARRGCSEREAANSAR